MIGTAFCSFGLKDLSESETHNYVSQEKIKGAQVFSQDTHSSIKYSLSACAKTFKMEKSPNNVLILCVYIILGFCKVEFHIKYGSPQLDLKKNQLGPRKAKLHDIQFTDI